MFILCTGKLNSLALAEEGIALAENEICLFLGYSDFEIPLGHTFNFIRFKDQTDWVSCKLTLKHITQQFRKTWDVIPRGWKTICVFKYENYCKELEQIKESDQWFSQGRLLVLCDTPSEYRE
jgi:hypothetical protein